MTELDLAQCPRCGKKFECGMKAGLGRCWCFSLPHALPVAVETECLCPTCLNEKIAAMQKLDPKDVPDPATK